MSKATDNQVDAPDAPESSLEDAELVGRLVDEDGSFIHDDPIPDDFSSDDGGFDEEGIYEPDGSDAPIADTVEQPQKRLLLNLDDQVLLWRGPFRIGKSLAMIEVDISKNLDLTNLGIEGAKIVAEAFQDAINAAILNGNHRKLGDLNPDEVLNKLTEKKPPT